MSPSGRFTHVMIYWTVWDRFIQVLYFGRAPRTKETLPIFVRNVGSPDIHQCFRGLTGSQRTPRNWGVIEREGERERKEERGKKKQRKRYLKVFL